ncbi:MAG: KEOPS complex subunit Pcc1 [Candidatus Nezhaarchaeales archaeon]
MKDELYVSLELQICSLGSADSLLKALRPDNVDIPQNMKLELEIDETDRNYLKIKIESSNVGSIINTMNDIFSCLQPALKLLSKASLSQQ